MSLNVVIEGEEADLAIKLVLVVDGFVDAVAAVVPHLRGETVDGLGQLVDHLFLGGRELVLPVVTPLVI